MNPFLIHYVQPSEELQSGTEFELLLVLLHPTSSSSGQAHTCHPFSNNSNVIRRSFSSEQRKRVRARAYLLPHSNSEKLGARYQDYLKKEPFLRRDLC